MFVFFGSVVEFRKHTNHSRRLCDNVAYVDGFVKPNVEREVSSEKHAVCAAMVVFIFRGKKCQIVDAMVEPHICFLVPAAQRIFLSANVTNSAVMELELMSR